VGDELDFTPLHARSVLHATGIDRSGWLLPPAAAGDVSVHTDYDPLASPDGGLPHLNCPGTNWSRREAGYPVQALVEQVVETRLSAMGYQKSDTNPEFRSVGIAALGDP
jgi:hypothetical protein